MEIIRATGSHVSKYADEFAGLIHATGPVTYDYHRAMGFECLVETVAPIPLDNGVPMEMRMAVDFS